MIALIFAYQLLKSNLGRRYSNILFNYAGAIFIFSLGLLNYISDEESWKALVSIIFAIICKVITSFCFIGMLIYAVELFPTTSRGTALGICGVLSRVGSLLAPQVLLLREMYHPMVTMSLMAAFLFFCGTIIFAVPETVNRELPNDLGDVKKVWGKKE